MAKSKSLGPREKSAFSEVLRLEDVVVRQEHKLAEHKMLLDYYKEKLEAANDLLKEVRGK